MKSFRLAVIVIGIAFLGSPSLKADTFNFGSCAQITTVGAVCPNVDSTKTLLTYSNGVLSVQASGWLDTGPGTNLFVKQSILGNETGLGTTRDVNNEINISDFVDLNLSNLVAHGIYSGMLTLESLQIGEGFRICKGNTVGSLGVPSSCVNGGAGTGTSTVSLTWTAATDIIGITAWNADGLHPATNVLIEGLNVPSSVPEPATLTLLGFGMVSLAGLRRSRKLAKN
jgi:hypothetical protein